MSGKRLEVSARWIRRHWQKSDNDRWVVALAAARAGVGDNQAHFGDDVAGDLAKKSGVSRSSIERHAAAGRLWLALKRHFLQSAESSAVAEQVLQGLHTLRHDLGYYGYFVAVERRRKRYGFSEYDAYHYLALAAYGDDTQDITPLSQEALGGFIDGEWAEPKPDLSEVQRRSQTVHHLEEAAKHFEKAAEVAYKGDDAQEYAHKMVEVKAEVARQKQAVVVAEQYEAGELELEVEEVEETPEWVKLAWETRALALRLVRSEAPEPLRLALDALAKAIEQCLSEDGV